MKTFCTIGILERNMLYFELYKKRQISDKYLFLYVATTFFYVAQNTMQFLPKFRTSIQDMCMYS
jgi:hypothetical protein